MKIWLLIVDNDGGTHPEVYCSEWARDQRCLAIVSEAWGDDDPCPQGWRAAYDLLQEASCGWWWHLSEHDLSGHPDLVTAKTALTQAETYIGAVSTRTQISLTRGQLIDLYDTVADAAAILAGRMTA